MSDGRVCGHRTLLVASTGGHLEELYRLRPLLRPESEHVEWATFDDPQSRSLLSDQTVHYVRYVRPRDFVAAAANVSAAFKILRDGAFDRIVSTGAGVAVPFMLAGRLRGVACHYVESAARAAGPSLTGRIVSKIPGISLYTQYPSWSSSRWHYEGSLFNQYTVSPDNPGLARPTRVVVTLGTMRGFGFRRAVDGIWTALQPLLTESVEVLWQVGATDVSHLPIVGHDLVPADQLRAEVEQADLVIAHAGIGSTLAVLDSGKCPVLLPRRARHGEHVDDHQELIAARLSEQGLAVTCEADELTTNHLLRAMSRSIISNQRGVGFTLHP